MSPVCSKIFIPAMAAALTCMIGRVQITDVSFDEVSGFVKDVHFDVSCFPPTKAKQTAKCGAAR